MVAASCIFLAALLLAPGSAVSAVLQPGVHGDPGTPAGKEYGFPLGVARSIGGNGGIFGAGITSAQGTATAVGASAATSADASSSRSGAASSTVGPGGRRGAAGGPRSALTGRSQSVGETTGSGAHTARAREPSSAKTGLVAAWTLAPALCVLVVGAGGAWALRRRARGSGA